jgi:hypothetical protein
VDLVSLVVLWLACVGIAAAISNSKGRGIGEGVLLGALLGILGVIIAACLSQRTPVQYVPPVPTGMVAIQCYRCNALQNVPTNVPTFECWQCKTANSTPGYVAPPQTPKALETRKVRCFKCDEVQNVPSGSNVVPCRKCGARMKIRPKMTT